MTEEFDHATERPVPLNLTDDEAAYLWKMMKREVGKEEVQYGDSRETAESLHSKVRSLVVEESNAGGAQ
ncbi:hypothetical protein [Salarchaeum japonicum]|uniref:Uncharacterized protein n=1 Tax=Salarchaeum japonicum TaxID=555573 RepID=A0AAV3T0G4_9EURY|nr:hypothetical protein [Salarchaeum japonicum]